MARSMMMTSFLEQVGLNISVLQISNVVVLGAVHTDTLTVIRYL